MGSLRGDRAQRARRRARRTGAVGFTAAAVLPVALWHRVIADIAAQFQFDLSYLVTGWTPWVLMAMGLCCFIPVWIADLRDRDRRFYTSGSGAWFGWGVTLYLLGFGLATQVAQIAGGLSAA
jgi:hypothetical protein